MKTSLHARELPYMKHFCWYLFSLQMSIFRVVKPKLLITKDELLNEYIFPTQTYHKIINLPTLLEFPVDKNIISGYTTLLEFPVDKLLLADIL